jgi:antibiotic biosynthesis monooxygenase (ABM) superfamily enzyme
MSSSDVSSNRPGVDGSSDSPVLLHVWTVLDPEREGVILDSLDRMLAATAAEPGFVSARVLRSANGGSIAVILEMRTSDDRARLEGLPWVQETLRHLDETMNIVVRLYQEVSEYHA